MARISLGRRRMMEFKVLARGRSKLGLEGAERAAQKGD
jgi:hypothetical protein